MEALSGWHVQAGQVLSHVHIHALFLPFPLDWGSLIDDCRILDQKLLVRGVRLGRQDGMEKIKRTLHKKKRCSLA